MIHGRDGPGRELGGGVARFARHRTHATRADREVVGREPTAVYAVVADGTARLYARMGEDRARPRHGVVAGVALKIRDDMTRWLALCLLAVVAHRAAAACLGVIEVDRRLPGDWRVARIARVGRHDVVVGLGGG